MNTKMCAMILDVNNILLVKSLISHFLLPVAHLMFSFTARQTEIQTKCFVSQSTTHVVTTT